MGFSDTFNKAFKDITKTGGLPNLKTTERITRTGLKGSLTLDKGESTKHYNAIRQGLAEGAAAGAATTLGPVYHAVRDDVLNPGGGATPPAVGDGPGVGSGDIEARQRARARAVADARRRRGSTMSTSPLGVQGEGIASAPRKRLLGE